MSIFAQGLGTDVVLRAANISSVLLGQWIRRGLIIGRRPDAGEEGGIKTGKQGLRRTYTYHQAVEIAVAAELARDGAVPVGRAFKAAASFAHSGNRGRLPGLPFEDGETFLAVAGDRSFVFVMDDEGLEEARRHLGEPFTMILLNVGRVVDRVIAAIGRRPQEEIEQAYQVAA